MTAYYNEIDPYAANWLKNLIAAGLIPAGDVDERDIRTVGAADLAGYRQLHFFAGLGGWAHALRIVRWPDERPVWTGSCPCQPYSLAGKQAGAADERHLWPAWFNLIRECSPAIVFGEQVAAAIGKGWLDAAFDDLEGQGYACASAVLPACAVGAPHVRDRLWFVAHADLDAGEQWRSGDAGQGPGGRDTDRSRVGQDVCDPNGARLAVGQSERSNTCEEQPATIGADWWSVEPDVGRVADGIPARVGKLRAFGNAIVPQVAAEFIRAAVE